MTPMANCRITVASEQAGPALFNRSRTPHSSTIGGCALECLKGTLRYRRNHPGVAPGTTLGPPGLLIKQRGLS
jgi:hypothetical protein